MTSPTRPRPPGWLWIDSSDRSHVVRCELCKTNIAIFDRLDRAKTASANHRASHDPAPTSWADAFGDEPLIHGRGGRPRTQPDKCTHPNCPASARSRGLCDTHYRRQRRQEAAS